MQPAQQSEPSAKATSSVVPTASLTEVSHFAFNSSISSGSFDDVRVLAFSKRFPSGRVGALRPLHANSSLIRRCLKNADLLLGNKKSNVVDVDDEDLERISAADTMSWRVSMSDYPEDSDLEDEDDPDPESESESADAEEHKTRSAPTPTRQNRYCAESDASEGDAESNKGPEVPTSPSDLDSVSTESKLDDFVSVEEVASAEQACPSPNSQLEEASTPKAKTRPSKASKASTSGDRDRRTHQTTRSPMSIPQSRAHTILAMDIAARTLRTLIFFSYTGRVAFAPLRSQGLLYKDNGGDPTQFPVCSPKSMYRLAIKYGNQELEAQARADIKSKLSTRSILDEFFSGFTARYPDIQELEVDFLLTNIKHPDIVVRLPLWVERFARGELRVCADTFTLLVNKLACAAVTPNALGSRPTPASCPKGCPMPTIQTQFRCSTCGFLMT